MFFADTDLDEGLDRSYDILTRCCDWVEDSGAAFLIDTAVALGIVLLGWLIAKCVRFIILRVLRRGGLQAKLRTQLLLSVGTGLWWLLIGFLVSRVYDINILPALTGISVAGIIVGFAFQETLSSLAAGVMMSFSDPFVVGDEVTIAGYNGIVRDFGYTSTVIRTWDARLVTIPNKQVWGSQIVNHTREKIRRVDRKVGIAYSSDVDKAIAVAREALLSMPQVLHDPAPQVWATSLDDSCVTLTCWPWVRTKDYWSFWETSYPIIKKALEENGITIPFPQMDVHLDRS